MNDHYLSLLMFDTSGIGLKIERDAQDIGRITLKLLVEFTYCKIWQNIYGFKNID
jgi:hypothetical protein